MNTLSNLINRAIPYSRHLLMLLMAMVCWGVTSAVYAEVSLPTLFSDHMVLQRDEPVVVWGFANPDEAVRVTFAEQTLDTVADNSGVWRVTLSAMPAGGPHTMAVSGSNTLTIQDVYIGEVWLCSGQSNMQWSVRNSNNAQEEAASADWPLIRMYSVKLTLSEAPQKDVAGGWAVCSPETVGHFSAVGYFFGRDLFQELDVPIGLVRSSWGGSRIESWIPRQALLTRPDFAEQIEQIDTLKAAYAKNKQSLDAEYQAALKTYQVQTAEWKELLNQGGNGIAEKWMSGEGDGWQAIEVPGAWESAGITELSEFDGVLWYVREVDIPNDWAGQALTLKLGAIDDLDATYFNGQMIGHTGTDTHNHWMHPRVYHIPGEMVTAGKAVLAVRVVDTGGSGGIIGGMDGLTLALSDHQSDPIDLAGLWRFKIDFPSSEMPPYPTAPVDPSRVGAEFRSPSAIYNGILHPLVPYTLRGTIWYQGESNAHGMQMAREYRELLSLMIQNWRDLWSKPDMPFGIVQLANYRAPMPEPTNSFWAELRESQLQTFKTVPNTGLAVTIDIGDANDIHPRNKQEVGRRLALWALANVYGRDDLVWSGPIYQSMHIEDGKACLMFDHVDGGLKVRDDNKLKGFAIAGVDGKYVWAEAKIVGDEVMVWSDAIPEPVSVRYGWADNPDTANLINASGLPASPFQADMPENPDESPMDTD